MKIKFTWLLVLKIFIVLFWTLGMAGFIFETIDNRKTFLEILSIHWVLFTAIFLGCISVILDFFFRNKNIMVSYFFIFFFYIILRSFFTFFKKYLSFVNYNYRWTHWYEFTINEETRYIALWFMFVGVYLCGFISYFQKNYQRAKVCLAICFINYIPFTFGQRVFDMKGGIW